jgi:ABC-2 type transport system permease protein
MNSIALIARKESGDLLLSLRGLGWLLTMAVVLSVFGLLLVGNTELSLLDNAQVVYDMGGIVTALGALLAVVVGTDSVAGERERGTLVPLLLTPISRSGILLGKLGGQMIAWAVTYVLALPYFWALGSTGQNLVDGAAAVALLGTPVVLGYGFLAMGLGARIASARSSLLTGLIFLLLSASPLLLGPSLRQSAVGRTFDAINPFSGALNAYDAVVIDSQTVVAQLPHFGVTLVWLGLTLWFSVHSLNRVFR